MPQPSAVRLLSACEAAEVLGVSRVTVWRMTTAGELRVAERTPKGQARYARAELDAIVEGKDAA